MIPHHVKVHAFGVHRVAAELARHRPGRVRYRIGKKRAQRLHHPVIGDQPPQPVRRKSQQHQIRCVNGLERIQGGEAFDVSILTAEATDALVKQGKVYDLGVNYDAESFKWPGHSPAVILTSNATRELSEALRRRCLYQAMDYPTAEREARIIRARVPDLPEKLVAEVTTFVAKARALELRKRPSVAEALDWAAALAVMNADRLHGDLVRDTIGALLKDPADIAAVLRGRGR